MKKFLYSFFFLGTIIFVSPGLVQCIAQTPGEWVWLHGDTVTNNPGSFGTQGVASPLNVPPSLYESCEWKDLNGNFWLFGGLHNGAVFSDLWKYNPATNEWTWMKGTGIPNNNLGTYGTQGVPSPLNSPPCSGFGINSWVDAGGNLWMFGGGSGNGIYNDLWRYEISSNEWTWMKGPGVPFDTGFFGIKGVPDPANQPACRHETAASWTDNNGDFWMFGGTSHIPFTPPAYNDLWKFNVASNNWTWMNGDSVPNQPSVYGTKGIESPANTPGARWVYTRWKDNSGYLWLYGGSEQWNAGYDTRTDLWRFNPATSQWAWMSGDSTGNTVTANGVQCIAANQNLPKNAFESRAGWTDQNGDFWAYIPANGILNSLWKYCKADDQWAIVKSDSLLNGVPAWGTKGVSSPSNIPPYLFGSIGWADDNGHLYMFGGWWVGNMWCNALWMYTIDPACAPCSTGIPVANFSATDTSICPGTCINLNNSSQFYTGYQWQFQGGNPSSSSLTNPQNICYPLPGNYDVTLIATGPGVSDTLTFPDYITVFAAPPPQSIIQSGDTLFANTGSASYQWYLNGNVINGATDYFYVATQSGDYNLIATDSNGCEVEAVIFNVIADLPSVMDLGLLTLFPNPVGDEVRFNIESRWLPGVIFKTALQVDISIYNTLGEIVMTASLHPDGYRDPNSDPIGIPTNSNSKLRTVMNVSELQPGLYFLEISSSQYKYRSKFIKQ
jgi:hypothetical protein